MKKLLSSAALIAGLSMIALPASAQVTGHAGASLGTLTADSGGTETDLDYMNVNGSVAFPVGSGLVAQVNASLNNIDSGTVEIQQTGVSGNLGIRNDQYAVAGYVGFKDSDVLDTGFLVGAEYLYFMPQLTLSAGAGFGTFDDADADLFGVSGEGRYFLNDNLRIDGRVYFSKIEVGAGGEADGFGGGIGAEWKPDNFPISVFGGWDFQPVDTGGTETDLSLLSIGVRFDFGQNTLKARDRNGASFKPAAGFGGPFNSLY